MNTYGLAVSQYNDCDTNSITSLLSTHFVNVTAFTDLSNSKGANNAKW